MMENDPNVFVSLLIHISFQMHLNIYILELFLIWVTTWKHMKIRNVILFNLIKAVLMAGIQQVVRE